MKATLLVMRLGPFSSANPAAKLRTSWDRSPDRLIRADIISGALLLVAVTAAFVIPHLHLSWLTPVHVRSAKKFRGFAGTAPILGNWLPHANWSTIGSIAVAVVVVALGARLARQLRWRSLVVVTWIGALSWTVVLTLIDGPKGGWAHRMDSTNGYLSQLPRSGGVSMLIHGFASRIPLASPTYWDDSIAGNPPGALLSFFGLNRIGLSGPWWASAFCVVVGSSAAAAILVTLRAVGVEQSARRVAPFLVLAPTAVWVGVSADGYFAAVAAWGIALLALSASHKARAHVVTAFVAGLVLGWSVYLDYGLILIAVPAVAVLIATRNYRPLAIAICGALVVAAFFTVEGFWWFHGLDLLRNRYWAGIAHDRPYRYWVWANFVSVTCAIGLPAAIALRRVFDRSELARRTGLHVVLVAFLIVIVISDVSGLSKSETERIWLPFTVWLVAAPVLLTRRFDRVSLTIQSVGALVINSLIFTNW